MNRAVDLNDQARFATIEVRDVRLHGVLAPESKAAQLASTDSLPENPLCGGGQLPVLLRQGF
jgi:hypothetical protein